MREVPEPHSDSRRRHVTVFSCYLCRAARTVAFDLPRVIVNIIKVAGRRRRRCNRVAPIVRFNRVYVNRSTINCGDECYCCCCCCWWRCCARRDDCRPLNASRPSRNAKFIVMTDQNENSLVDRNKRACYSQRGTSLPPHVRRVSLVLMWASDLR